MKPKKISQNVIVKNEIDIQAVMTFFSFSSACVLEHVYDCMCMCVDVKCWKD